jgi:hypothetical protein
MNCQNKKLITLIKTDDTDFAGRNFIRVNVKSEFDLTDYKLGFVLCGVLKEFSDLQEDIVINYSQVETEQFSLGINYATIYLEDADGRKKTLTNRIPVKVTNTVIENDLDANSFNLALGIPLFDVNVKINDNTPVVFWGEIKGALEVQTDLTDALETKQDSVSDLLETIDKSIVGAINEINATGGAAGSEATWGAIGGTLGNQTDLADALEAKEDVVAAGETTQYYRGDKTWQTLNKSAVGLGNVNNTSDASKPVSTEQQTALDAKINKSISTTLVNDAAVNSNTTSTVILDLSNVNTGTGSITTKQVSLPVVSATSAGVALPSLYSQVQENTENIEAITGEVIYLDAYDFGTDTPTQAALNAYALSWAEAHEIDWSEGIPGGTDIINSYNGQVIEFIYNPVSETWVKYGSATVAQATNTALGIVKGSTTEGQAFVELDGTMSVNGWDALNTSVSGLSSSKQDSLTTAQLSAVNSGITSTKVTSYDGYATGKQDALTTAQLAAVNSGVSADALTEIAEQISELQDELLGASEALEEVEDQI